MKPTHIEVQDLYDPDTKLIGHIDSEGFAGAVTTVPTGFLAKKNEPDGKHTSVLFQSRSAAIRFIIAQKTSFTSNSTKSHENDQLTLF